MKKNLFISLFVLLLTLAMIAGGTMAWFTAEDEAGEVIFTSGTVEIVASNWGIGSQFFDPDVATYVYGVEQVTGDIYEVDVKNGIANKLKDIPNLSPNNQNSPNGLAFDDDNRRLYFSVYGSEAISKSDIWFYDFLESKLYKAGSVNAVIAGAAFGNGYMWYIKNDTDELYKIEFDSDGKNPIEILVDSITNGDKAFRFGDIALDIRGDIIYGSTLQGQSIQTPPEFFKYDLNTGIYEQILQDGISSKLQLAFGSDNLLYGHATGTGTWYMVNTDTGEAQSISVSGNHKFTDLASGYVSVWNPGDSSKLRYSITNTGSKATNIRAKLEGVWDDAGLDSDVVSVELCQDSDWVLDGDYFYYNANDGVVPAGETIELCIVVSLAGGSTGNDYQGKSFIITGMVEAIQASNNASSSKWQITLPIS